jgi:hypothetical protein
VLWKVRILETVSEFLFLFGMTEFTVLGGIKNAEVSIRNNKFRLWQFVIVHWKLPRPLPLTFLFSIVVFLLFDALWSMPVVFNLFCSRTLTLYPQSCCCIIQVIRSLWSTYKINQINYIQNNVLNNNIVVNVTYPVTCFRVPPGVRLPRIEDNGSMLLMKRR